MPNDVRIGRLHELLRSGETTAEKIVAAVLDRVTSLEATLNAFIILTPERALAEARAVDQRIARGEEIDPLAGIPVALADNICTEALRTTCASRMLGNFIPPFSAVVSNRLRQAGSVLIGKTNLDEFGMGTAGIPVFGPVPNPWDPTRLSGWPGWAPAAVVAARQTALSIASDAGGALRRSAAGCGMVGLKPTYGLVPTHGLIEFAPSLDHLGPLTLDVTGCALALQAIAGADAQDGFSTGTAGEDYTGYLGRGVRGRRIGVPREYLPPETHPEVRKAFEKSLDLLADLGAEVEEASLPHIPYAPAAHLVLASAEAFSNLSNFDGVRFGHRAEARHLHEMYRRTRHEGFGPEVRRRIVFGTLVLSADYFEDYFVKAQKVRTLVRRDFEQAFKRYDLLAAPTVPVPATAASGNGGPPEMRPEDLTLVPANLAGIPALSLPVGFAEGLPVGLQLMGPPFGEGVLFSAGYALEQQTGFYRTTPPITGTEG